MGHHRGIKWMEEGPLTLKEDLENTSSLLVDESRNSLDTTWTRRWKEFESQYEASAFDAWRVKVEARR